MVGMTTEAAPRWWARPKADLLVVCDHASNWIPPALGGLGLGAPALNSHDAWDIGALALAQALSQRLQADLLASPVSRLVIDCNRSPSSPYLIPLSADDQAIPGNASLDAAEVAHRLAAFHQPYHRAIASWLEARGLSAKALISVHSFTPTFGRESRPWLCGLLHDEDELSLRLLGALRDELGDAVGDNQPYGPHPDYDHTVPEHAYMRNLPAVLIEVRNDQLCDTAVISLWADRLAKGLMMALNERGQGQTSTR